MLEEEISDLDQNQIIQINLHIVKEKGEIYIPQMKPSQEIIVIQVK